MIDDVKSPIAAWPVDGGYIDQATELAGGIVAQKAHDFYDLWCLGRYGEFAMHDCVTRYRRTKRAGDRSAERVDEGLIHFQRSIVAVRRIFFWSRRTPY